MSVQINRMCYFPLDVRFFENDKIESITTKFGLRAVPIVIRLLCDIHADGYYIRWDDDKSRLMARKLGTRNVVFINQVVQGLLEIGFFDAESYTKHGILTSKSIQEVYLDFIGKCRSNYIQNTEYLIIDQRPKRKYTKRQIQIDEKQASLVEMEANASLSDLVSALNNIGVTPMDLIAILQALSTAGSLQAELEVI